MRNLTCLTHTVYVLADDAVYGSPATLALRPATRADVANAALKLGCLTSSGVVPLSTYERAHSIRSEAA